MKKIMRRAWGGTTVVSLNIAQFVGDRLNGDDYDRGQLESARKTADNATAALGRLVQLLTDRGLLNASDIAFIVYGHDDGSYTLVDEET